MRRPARVAAHAVPSVNKGQGRTVHTLTRPSTAVRPAAAFPRPARDNQILTTRVGLRLPAGLSFEEWKQAGPKLFRIADSSAWCLGDWLIHGQERYGDRYRIATQEAGLDYQTLRNYAWIARKFDITRRRERLSFQHHAEVASLPIEQQDLWLDRAEQFGWSRNQLRRNLRGRDEQDWQTMADATYIPRMRVPQGNLERWREAARNSSSGFSRWVVEALDQAAGKVLDGGALNGGESVGGGDGGADAAE
ncbi:LmbU family transcriptional regulator [Kutzneria buriramensis]|uniref:LmbU family transcriptional regulator n=1 Tax=Kutzneria buriramensis TaxID=1045776 RepID=UPI002482EBC3|nr:LmbU family transcriptional regulator [Kutzneria buriramensis]